MTLRTETVVIDGRSIVAKEISFGAMLRLPRPITNNDLWREMLSPEDFAFLDTIGRNDFDKLHDAFIKLQTVDKLVTDYEKKN
jgi:hypothetical protein